MKTVVLLVLSHAIVAAIAAVWAYAKRGKIERELGE